MIKHTILNNQIVNWLPFEAKSPLIQFVPRESEQAFPGTDYNYDPSASLTTRKTQLDTEHGERQTLLANVTPSSLTDIEKATMLELSSRLSSTHWAGVKQTYIPTNIQDKFVNFTLIDLANNNVDSLTSATTVNTFEEALYENSDTDRKIIDIMPGLQALRLPVNRLNELIGDELFYNFGRYYIRIAPKYIETEIDNIHSHFSNSFDDWSDTAQNNPQHLRRTSLVVQRDAFYDDTIWDFRSHPTLNESYQNNRLTDSIIEIYNSNGTQLKATKTIISDYLNHNAATVSGFYDSSQAVITISPDYFGWDPQDQVPMVGDIVRIYPRESYFEPIIIELDYKNQNLDFSSLLQFLQHDVVRDTKTGIFDIYDETGVTVDSNGNIDGRIVQSYQIFAAGDGSKEVRKRLELPTQDTGTSLNSNTTGLNIESTGQGGTSSTV